MSQKKISVLTYHCANNEGAVLQASCLAKKSFLGLLSHKIADRAVIALDPVFISY